MSWMNDSMTNKFFINSHLSPPSDKKMYSTVIWSAGSFQKMICFWIKEHVKNLGVYIDSSLKMNTQINHVVKSIFFHLRNLAKMKSCLTFKRLEIAIHALISSRLDYCKSLYKGISQASILRLQKVQNAAARLLMNIKKREHITASLISLHWLPVQYRIDFKLILLVYKSLHGLAPTYLSELLIKYRSGRTLKSTTQTSL